MRQYNLTVNNTTYEVIICEVTEEDVTAKVNGKEYVVKIHDVQDLSKSVSVSPFQAAQNPPQLNQGAAASSNTGLQGSAASSSAVASAGAVTSPMPGQIIKIFVNKGDTVLAGQKLMVLEAMKLENTITASQEGTIQSISVKEGDIVNQNQLLVEME